ncbi:hypothetical protein [Bacillus suaedaesalsae]|uniref:Preprotein translocase subunit SecA n=1 Tax=Bacillus suaedaesalsae TaxID=2810349 RepID=A0ABS2DK76_9BACI|nr:hypothetical protein [Bacillus suaedaesalsae]MBM6617863.1 hypothetical protein [Bacillus suaedaesalsae]
MFNVSFYDKKDVLLVQYRSQVPAEGEELKVKGRKGKVTRVETVTEHKFNVHVELEAEKKNNMAADAGKKKKR